MKSRVNVHFGGQTEVCGFELAEEETVGSFINRLGKDGHFGSFKPEEWSICVEDSDEELAHNSRFEHAKHKRVHIGRCKKVDVGITFNGDTKSHTFPSGTTLRKVIEWARDQFSVDKKEKLVLRLGSADSEPLDPDSHVGSYVQFPHCQVTFYLTPKVRIEG